jgi:hypothetical protein
LCGNFKSSGSGQFECAEIIIVGCTQQVHLQIIAVGKIHKCQEFMHGHVELVKKNDIAFFKKGGE